MRAEKTQSPNPGIKCVVNTCYYYGNGDHCHAQTIQVEPPQSSTTEDTDCATFMPR